MAEKVDAASRRVSTTGLAGQQPVSDIGYFDLEQPVGYLAGNLPHWRQEGVTYYVTFRLGDSIPKVKLDLWRRERSQWLAAHPGPHTLQQRREYHERFVERIEKWLDAGAGSCALADADARQIVVTAMRKFDGLRYLLGERVVMPNHVHAIITPMAGRDLSPILHSWKSFTGHELNRRLGRHGAFWQKESFDHAVRSPESLERFIGYIRANPRLLPSGSFSRSCDPAGPPAYDRQH